MSWRPYAYQKGKNKKFMNLVTRILSPYKKVRDDSRYDGNRWEHILRQDA